MLSYRVLNFSVDLQQSPSLACKLHLVEYLLDHGPKGQVERGDEFTAKLLFTRHRFSEYDIRSRNGSASAARHREVVVRALCPHPKSKASNLSGPGIDVYPVQVIA